MPPVRRLIASIFWVCRSWRSAFCRTAVSSSQLSGRLDDVALELGLELALQFLRLLQSPRCRWRWRANRSRDRFAVRIVIGVVVMMCGAIDAVMAPQPHLASRSPARLPADGLAQDLAPGPVVRMGHRSGPLVAVGQAWPVYSLARRFWKIVRPRPLEHPHEGGQAFRERSRCQTAAACRPADASASRGADQRGDARHRPDAGGRRDPGSSPCATRVIAASGPSRARSGPKP